MCPGIHGLNFKHTRTPGVRGYLQSQSITCRDSTSGMTILLWSGGAARAPVDPLKHGVHIYYGHVHVCIDIVCMPHTDRGVWRGCVCMQPRGRGREVAAK